MDLIAFDYDRSFVLGALRNGDLDYLEHVSEAADADLIRHLIRRQIIQRLAEIYLTPRNKEEVPVWIYLSSELSLKLHGAQSYHAFPRILRSGGLIDALGPEMGGRKTQHPDTGDVTLACRASMRKTITTAKLPETRTSSASSPATPIPITCTHGSTAKIRAVCAAWDYSTPKVCSSATLPTYSYRTMTTTRNRTCFGLTSTSIHKISIQDRNLRSNLANSHPRYSAQKPVPK